MRATIEREAPGSHGFPVMAPRVRCKIEQIFVIDPAIIINGIINGEGSLAAKIYAEFMVEVPRSEIASDQSVFRSGILMNGVICSAPRPNSAAPH